MDDVKEKSMKQKVINQKDLESMKPIYRDSFKTQYQVSDSIWEIYQTGFLKEMPYAKILDFQKMQILKQIEDDKIIIPSSILIDEKTNQYIGYETDMKDLISFPTFCKQNPSNLDIITNYYLQILSIIESLHQEEIVIPSLFWDNHLLIDSDTEEIYLTNLIHAQINDLPAMIVDPKIYLLQQKHLPNFYRDNHLFHPNVNQALILTHYFYDCTHVDLLASFCYQYGHPEIIYRFFSTFGLKDEKNLTNVLYELFSTRKIHIEHLHTYLQLIRDSYELTAVEAVPQLKKFTKVKNKALSRS